MGVITLNKDISMLKKFTLIIISVLITACAGPNPNIGERTTDVNWTSGNYKAAFDTAEIYAKNGEPWAQLRLGIFYYNGWGVKKDNKTALNWYKKAAAQTATGAWADGQIVGATGKTGYFNQNSDAIIAKFNLAQMYFEGSSITQDLDKSLELINDVIKSSKGVSIFFCCEFSTPLYFNPDQFSALKLKIETEQEKNL